MKDYLLKDKILNAMLPDSAGRVLLYSSEELSEKFNIDENLIVYIIDQINEDGYIESRKSSKVTTLSGRVISINHKGMAFISFEGYEKIEKQNRIKNNWIKAKTIATVIYSIAVLLVAAWGVKAQIDANKKDEPTLKSKEKEITYTPVTSKKRGKNEVKADTVIHLQKTKKQDI